MAETLGAALVVGLLWAGGREEWRSAAVSLGLGIAVVVGLWVFLDIPVIWRFEVSIDRME